MINNRVYFIGFCNNLMIMEINECGKICYGCIKVRDVGVFFGIDGVFSLEFRGFWVRVRVV